MFRRRPLTPEEVWRRRRIRRILFHVVVPILLALFSFAIFAALRV